MEYPGSKFRDALHQEYLLDVCEAIDFYPFFHQAAWWAQYHGRELLDRVPTDEEIAAYDRRTNQSYRWIRLADKTTARRAQPLSGEPNKRVLAQLTAFKGGKSQSVSVFVAGFAACPKVLYDFIGQQYPNVKPEFEYLIEVLLSEEGLNLPHVKYNNNYKQGDVFIELEQGQEFVGYSYKNMNTLKGAERDGYVLCEAYQLPGSEVVFDYEQNLRKRDGSYFVPTTADHAWVSMFHKLGHGQDADYDDWCCVCGIHQRENPYTWSEKRARQAKKGKTKDKYDVHIRGLISAHIGKVYPYSIGQREFNRETHPRMWHEKLDDLVPENMKIPRHWEGVCGFDYGTYRSAVLSAFDENGEMWVLLAFPNYQYRQFQIDRNNEYTLKKWTEEILFWQEQLGPTSWMNYGDPNTQWAEDLWYEFGIDIANGESDRELRSDNLMLYFDQDIIHFSPFVRTVLGVEIENAAQPEGQTRSGKNPREKFNDHSLDCLEHGASTKMIASPPDDKDRPKAIESIMGITLPTARTRRDPALGSYGQ